jgi:SHS2 domain-containing protein
MMKFYRELDHIADWAIEVWGQDLAALFEHAAVALFEMQGADLTIEPTVAARVSCQGMDLETLLVAWLNELLYLSEINDALFTRFDVAIEGDLEPTLTARVRGVPGRGHLAHVKAITYYHLTVEQAAEAWRATVTFDT